MIKIDGQKSQRVGLNGTVGLPIYKGDYEVTPMVVEDVILHTEGRKLKGNVKVNKIPVFQESNPEGGETLIIGGEYYGD